MCKAEDSNSDKTEQCAHDTFVAESVDLVLNLLFTPGMPTHKHTCTGTVTPTHTGMNVHTHMHTHTHTP